MPRLKTMWRGAPKLRLLAIVLFVLAYFAAFSRGPLLLLMSLALLATSFMMWLIVSRLRQLIVSPAYMFIFAGMVCAFILCAAGVYLIIWPVPRHWRLRMTNIWFALFALNFILSDIGHWLYSRDLAAVLHSDRLADELPAVPRPEPPEPPSP